MTAASKIQKSLQHSLWKPATGQSPAWFDAEIDDVITFLQTLTDRDVRPASYQRP